MDSGLPKVGKGERWLSDYRMHKKGVTEEVAKKRSRKNVKVQVSALHLWKVPSLCSVELLVPTSPLS